MNEIGYAALLLLGGSAIAVTAYTLLSKLLAT